MGTCALARVSAEGVSMTTFLRVGVNLRAKPARELRVKTSHL